jgi:endonuclease-3
MIQPRAEKQEKYRACVRLLKQHYSNTPPVSLVYESPFQLLVASILFVQSNEAIVNAVTQQLFAEYPTPQAVASADSRKLQLIIQPTKFHRRKAKHLQLACEMLLVEFNGTIPSELTELTKLPGISRRSAYFILSELYGKMDGIIVDSRVWRVSQRLGLATGHSAEAIESQLIEYVPHADWKTLNTLFTQHADTLCTVQSPQCSKCPLSQLCSANGVKKSRGSTYLNGRTSYQLT